MSRSRQGPQFIADRSRAVLGAGREPRARRCALVARLSDGEYPSSVGPIAASSAREGRATEEPGSARASGLLSVNGRLSSYARAAADPAATSHTPMVTAMNRPFALGIACFLLSATRPDARFGCSE